MKSESSITALGLTIWGLGALFFLYEFFLQTFVGSIAHQIIPDLNLNAETFALIGSAYYISYGIMQIPVGILSDKFGVKVLLIFATLVCVISTFLFAHSVGFANAFASRFFMGLGSSFAFVCLLVITTTWFPKKYFGFFAGTAQLIGTLGPILAGGPLIALMAHTHQDWRTTLSEIGICGIILTVLIFCLVKDKPRDGTKNLIFLKPEKPLQLQLYKLLQNKQAWAVAFYSATVYVSMPLLGAVWGTKYLQVCGLSQKTSASIISLAWIGYAIGCPLLGAFSDISKRRRPTLIFCSLLGLAATAAITYLPIHHSCGLSGFLFICLGVSASGQNVGFATIAEHSDPSTRATSLGLNNGVIILFAAFIPPITSYFISQSSDMGMANLKPEDFSIAFTIMPTLYLISFIMSYFYIKETFCKSQKESVILQTQKNSI